MGVSLFVSLVVSRFVSRISLDADRRLTDNVTGYVLAGDHHSPPTKRRATANQKCDNNPAILLGGQLDMKLVTYENGGAVKLGAVQGDKIADLAALAGSGGSARYFQSAIAFLQG